MVQGVWITGPPLGQREGREGGKVAGVKMENLLFNLLTPFSEIVPLYQLPPLQKTFHSSVERNRVSQQTGK